MEIYVFSSIWKVEFRLSLFPPPSLCTYTYRCDHFTSIFSLRLNVFLVHLRNYRAFRLRVASMNFFRNENFSLSFFSSSNRWISKLLDNLLAEEHVRRSRGAINFARVNIEMKREREERKEEKRVHDIVDESHVPYVRREKLTTPLIRKRHDRTFELRKKMEKELSAAPALLDFSVTVCVTELSERLLLEGGDWRYHHATLRSPTSPFLFLYAPRSLRRGRPQALSDRCKILRTTVNIHGSEVSSTLRLSSLFFIESFAPSFDE